MNAVIGTAGHVDHGKSSLIQALTGIHPSHLPQELLREMTIDLGFAHFSAPDGTKIGIVDVPGHERFIRNMVSAVWGLDLVLFVVAADEGWAPLSMEHLRIISAMGIKECILVLNKCDLVDKEALSIVENEALEHFLNTMDILPDVAHVSAYKGDGIAELKAMIIDRVAKIDHREDLDRMAHIYVDRVFSVNGIGTTITGTLRGAEVKENDTLTLFPGRQSVKVRSLQSYHEQITVAQPYSRTAIGLKQVNKKSISRGSCLVANPDAILMSTDWIVQLDPKFISNLKKQSIVEVALGTTHTRAKCFVYADGKLARLQLEEEVPAFWGQPLLLIQHGGSQIIGSGRLVWVGTLDRKMRTTLEETLPKVVIRSADLSSKVTLDLALNGFTVQIENVATPKNTSAIGRWWITPEKLDQIQADCDTYLNNVLTAINSEELARSTKYPIALVEALVDKNCDNGNWQKIKGGIVSSLKHEDGKLSDNLQNILDLIIEADRQGFDLSKADIVGIRRLLRPLAEKDLIITTEDDLVFTTAIYDTIVKEIMQGRSLGERFTVAEARDRTGLSRKQLIPLFNRMQRDGWVRRIENDREVTKVYGN